MQTGDQKVRRLVQKLSITGRETVSEIRRAALRAARPETEHVKTSRTQSRKRFVFTCSASGRMLAGEAGQPVESKTRRRN
jgi:hypothetical protein